jgi:hypothetical protein
MLDSISAMTDTLPAADAQGAGAPHHLNSVDATIGQPMVARVIARKQELETLLASLSMDDIRTRGDIGLALSTIGELLTGDLTHVPPVVVADMNRWLERNKHLAESAIDVVVDPVTAPVAAPETAPIPGG